MGITDREREGEKDWYTDTSLLALGHFNKKKESQLVYQVSVLTLGLDSEVFDCRASDLSRCGGGSRVHPLEEPRYWWWRSGRGARWVKGRRDWWIQTSSDEEERERALHSRGTLLRVAYRISQNLDLRKTSYITCKKTKNEILGYCSSMYEGNVVWSQQWHIVCMM